MVGNEWMSGWMNGWINVSQLLIRTLENFYCARQKQKMPKEINFIGQENTSQQTICPGEMIICLTLLYGTIAVCMFELL